jgi:hypothetical protein
MIALTEVVEISFGRVALQSAESETGTCHLFRFSAQRWFALLTPHHPIPNNELSSLAE